MTGSLPRQGQGCLYGTYRNTFTSAGPAAARPSRPTRSRLICNRGTCKCIQSVVQQVRASASELRTMLPSMGCKDRVSCRFVLRVRDLESAAVRHVRANFLISCHGLHGRQLGPADHGVPVSKRFRGTVTLGGRSDGVDSAVGTTCVNGKVLTVAHSCQAFPCILQLACSLLYIISTWQSGITSVAMQQHVRVFYAFWDKSTIFV